MKVKRRINDGDIIDFKCCRLFVTKDKVDITSHVKILIKQVNLLTKMTTLDKYNVFFYEGLV